ncbi:MAG: carbohydrate binding domain-containing protein [Anaerolineae bacterium]|nr:carbohydrate binding domain-containing protein [Anaerolineae bacterium]
MAQRYNTENIQNLLLQGFEEEELRNFCFHNPAFQAVHDTLRETDRKPAIGRRIIEHSARQNLFDVLLGWAQIKNPGMYSKYEPYFIDETEPPLPQPAEQSETVPAPSTTPLTTTQKWKLILFIILILVLAIGGLLLVFGIFNAPPTPTLIADMETPWTKYDDDQGSIIAVQSQEGNTNLGNEISFNLQQNGYVGIVNDFPVGILSGTTKISFWYKGDGASNTLELKLVYAEEDCGGGKMKSAIFSTEWRNETDTNGKWQQKEVDYRDLGYWAGNPQDPEDLPSGCNANETFDAGKVDRIHFAVSHRGHEGDEGGQGNVVIDDVWAQ